MHSHIHIHIGCIHGAVRRKVGLISMEKREEKNKTWSDNNDMIIVVNNEDNHDHNTITEQNLLLLPLFSLPCRVARERKDITVITVIVINNTSL